MIRMETVDRIPAREDQTANIVEPDVFWAEQILNSVRGIRFGSVQIVIHDGRIVQIDRTEKRRFDGRAPVLNNERREKKGQGHGK